MPLSLMNCGKIVLYNILRIVIFSLLSLKKPCCIYFRKTTTVKFICISQKIFPIPNGDRPFVCMDDAKCCLETPCYQTGNTKLEKFPDSRFAMIICNGKFQRLVQDPRSPCLLLLFLIWFASYLAFLLSPSMCLFVCLNWTPQDLRLHTYFIRSVQSPSNFTGLAIFL